MSSGTQGRPESVSQALAVWNHMAARRPQWCMGLLSIVAWFIGEQVPPDWNRIPRAVLQGRHALSSTSSLQCKQVLGKAAPLFGRSAQLHTSKLQRASAMRECGVLFKKQHRYKVPKQHIIREGELNTGCVL